MKNSILMVVLFVFYACSSSDDEAKMVQSEEYASVELLQVDSCFASLDYSNPTMGVESFSIKQNVDGFYSVRVLGNTQCSPAEKPDYLEYSYKGDTLKLDIYKKDRIYDVTCSCMYWADVLIKGEISFDKIQINGNVYSVSRQ
jgi:hypothetical protein